MMDMGLDSMKNSLVYLHHSQFGSGLWSNVMNYPYGEHIVFTDGFPLLSVFSATFIHAKPETALAIMWYFIALSFLLSIIYIYLTLTFFEVKTELAIIFSILICLMSPQVFRLQAHYSLSIFCVIPILFYWSVKYHATRRKKYAIFLSILGVLASFIHPYFSAMMLLWTMCYSLGCLIFKNGSLKEKFIFLLPILLGGLAAFCVFGITMKLTDPVKDRTILPYGALFYLTDFPSVVTSNVTGVWDFFKAMKWVAATPPGSEGIAYIGFVTEVVLILSVFTGTYLLLKKKQSDLILSETRFSPIWLFIAGVMLILSLGIPFIWHMEWLLNYLSVFKQFRSLGRFNWIFYYIVNVYSAIILDGWYKHIKAKRFGILYSRLLLTIVFALWASEAGSYVDHIHSLAKKGKYNYSIIYSKGEQTWEQWLQKNNFKSTDFQAILVAEMVNVGTDKYWIGENGLWGLSLGEVASLQLNLPLVDALISRASWGQARKQLKLVAGPFVEKPMLHDIVTDKPFLLLHFVGDSLKPDDKYLLKAADSLGRHFDCDVYAFYPKRQLANDRKWADSVTKIINSMISTDTCVGSSEHFHMEHFNANRSNLAFYGSGAMPKNMIKDSVILDIPVDPTDNELYEFSSWFLFDKNTFLCPEVFFHFFDSSGNAISIFELNAKTCVDNNDLWSRANIYFRMPPNARRLTVWIRPVSDNDYIVLDEIMLRKENSIIISKLDDGKIMVNNHWFNKSASH